MKKTTLSLLLLPLLFAANSFGADFDRFRSDNGEHWVATWSTTLHPPDITPGPSNPGFKNQTLRQIVHTSIGGRQVRVRFSAFGAGELAIGAAHLALSKGGASISAASDHTLTFGGQRSIRIPSGAQVVSDPVNMDVPPLSDLAITTFAPGMSGPATWHFDSRQTTYISPAGDFTASSVLPLDPSMPNVASWFWLAGVDVVAPAETGVIATFGESTTDGAQSTVDENHRWPDWLARRLTTELRGHNLGVVNQGLDGNRLLHDGLGPNGMERFERDVLSQPGLSHVIVDLGNNDIGAGWAGGTNPDQEVSVAQIIQVYRQLIEKAHARGARIYGGTLGPVKGFLVPGTPFSLYSPANELKRQAVNAWIRRSGEFDGVIDFDRVLRDPADPAQIRPKYDSGDHGHPTDAGYQAMADAIDLQLFANDRRR